MPKARPALTLSLSLLIFLFANLISPPPTFSQAEAEEETITISTYYPAPYGVYNEMRAKRMAVGTNYYDGSAYPWDTGGVCVNEICNADLAVQGNVGIGTAEPSAGGERDLKLDVDGAIGAKYYCDQDGNNCASAPLGGGKSIKQVTATTIFRAQSSGWQAYNDLTATINITGSKVLVMTSGSGRPDCGGGGDGDVGLRINRDNGTEYGNISYFTVTWSGYYSSFSGQYLFEDLIPGNHTFKVEFKPLGPNCWYINPTEVKATAVFTVIEL